MGGRSRLWNRTRPYPPDLSTQLSLFQFNYAVAVFNAYYSSVTDTPISEGLRSTRKRVPTTMIVQHPSPLKTLSRIGLNPQSGFPE